MYLRERYQVKPISTTDLVFRLYKSSAIDTAHVCSEWFLLSFAVYRMPAQHDQYL